MWWVLWGSYAFLSRAWNERSAETHETPQTHHPSKEELAQKTSQSTEESSSACLRS
jgi:hypothetical protein